MRFKNFYIVIYYDIFRNKNYCSQTPNLIFLGSNIPVLTPRLSDGPQESQKNSGILRLIINKSHFYKWRHQKKPRKFVEIHFSRMTYYNFDLKLLRKSLLLIFTKKWENDFIFFNKIQMMKGVCKSEETSQSFNPRQPGG